MSFAREKLKNNKLIKTAKEFYLIMKSELKKISPNLVGGD